MSTNIPANEQPSWWKEQNPEPLFDPLGAPQREPEHKVEEESDFSSGSGQSSRHKMSSRPSYYGHKSHHRGWRRGHRSHNWWMPLIILGVIFYFSGGEFSWWWLFLLWPFMGMLKHGMRGAGWGVIMVAVGAYFLLGSNFGLIAGLALLALGIIMLLRRGDSSPRSEPQSGWV
jgi:hypothetical protein